MNALAGVWHAGFGRRPIGAARRFARAVEAAGFGSLWFGESSSSREPMTLAGELLAATNSLQVGTGIASIWVRDAVVARAAASTLAESSGDRFVLGLGVSHEDMVRDRRREYVSPLTEMAQFLDDLDSPAPAATAWLRPFPRVLAALGPRMLQLAGSRTGGAHTYFVPVSHTAYARGILGPAPLLLPEQAFITGVGRDPARARAREHMAFYLAKPNYRAMLLRSGYSEDDLSRGGSDRLVDDLVVWGDADEVVERLAQQVAAGATQVLLQPLQGDLERDLSALETVAAALPG